MKARNESSALLFRAATIGERRPSIPAMPAVERFSYWSPLPDGRGFHEKAGRCQHFFSSWPLPTNGRRNSALPSSFFLGRFSSLAESPCFHSHSRWSGLLRCQLGSSISNGCCHLCAEVTPCFQKRSFRRDHAVTRTRRLATNLSSSSCSLFQPLPGVAIAQRLVHFTAHPQGVK